MFKRILTAALFVVALGAGGLGMSSQAEAGHGCGYGGYGGYGYTSHYYPGSYGYYGYSPRASYYRSYDYPSHYYGRGHHGHHHHHHDHGGVSFSIGF